VGMQSERPRGTKMLEMMWEVEMMPKKKDCIDEREGETIEGLW